MRRGHKTLRTPAGKIVAQRFRPWPRGDLPPRPRRRRERAPDGSRSVTPSGHCAPGRSTMRALPFMHELRHARGEKRRRAGQIAFRKRRCAWERFVEPEVWSVTMRCTSSLRHAEKFPVVVQIFRRGEGKPGKIGRRVDVEIAAGERALVPAAEGKGAAQGAAQGLQDAQPPAFREAEQPDCRRILRQARRPAAREKEA